MAAFAGLLTTALVALFVGTVSAHAEYAVPRLTGPVVDEARILDPGTREVIADGLRRLNEGGGSQIQVLIVKTLDGTPIEEASIKTTDAWRLGSSKGDNGALLLVSIGDRQMRIEVGQGLEGVLTDAHSKRIIEDTIKPYFKANRYDEGVLNGVAEIVRHTDPGVDVQQLFGAAAGERPQAAKGKGGISLVKLILFVLFLLFIIRPRRRRGSFFSNWGAGAIGYGLGRGGWGGGGGSGGGSWGGGGGGFSGGGASGGW